MSDLYNESLELHRKLKGKIGVLGKAELKTAYDLSVCYTPGVAEPCRAIAKDKSLVYDLTFKNNTVGIITDGTRVLGLGNIGPEAALPVMEGKALIMKQFANIDAIPICLKTKTADEFVETVQRLEPIFGAINLEDIETPKVWDIEKRLTDSLSIPVFHDDQHGTAMVALAGLINALKVVGKNKDGIKVGVVGAGSAGFAITKLLSFYGVKDITCFDSKGALHPGRKDMNQYKFEIANLNSDKFSGKIDDFSGADVIISASKPGAVPDKTIKQMNKNNIVFALSNPVSEISLEQSRKLGITVFGTGRSDYPNQINNSICFPGFLRALLDLKIKKINYKMFVAASTGIANTLKNPTAERIVPDVFDKNLVPNILASVRKSID
ncbi:MAG: NADP-dependent malic enzyme [Candidatus Micrarchaeota archaeon]